MVTAVLIGQVGNGGAAMKAGNHASQKGGGGGGGGGSNAAKAAMSPNTDATSLSRFDRATLSQAESKLIARKDQIEKAMDNPSVLANPSREDRLFNQSVRLDLAINKLQIAKGTARLGVGRRAEVSRFERTNRPTVAGRRML